MEVYHSGRLPWTKIGGNEAKYSSIKNGSSILLPFKRKDGRWQPPLGFPSIWGKLNHFRSWFPLWYHTHKWYQNFGRSTPHPGCQSQNKGLGWDSILKMEFIGPGWATGSSKLKRGSAWSVADVQCHVRASGGRLFLMGVAAFFCVMSDVFSFSQLWIKIIPQD